MREARLLERIRLREKEPHRRDHEDPARVIDSVIAHLGQILNTRRGNVPIASDYGIPDYTELLHHYPESLREFERAIRQTILHYEPRLKAIRVNFIPHEEDPFSVRFQINAKLTTSSGTTAVLFESLLDTDGRFSVRG